MDQTSQPELGPKFVYPIQRTQLLELQNSFQDMYSHKIHEFADDLETTSDLLDTLTHEWDLPADLDEHNIFHNRRVAAAAAAGISKQKIQDLDAQLQQLLEPALTLAMQKLTTVKAKPEKHYLCRADKKRLMDLIEKGKRARSAYEEGPKDPVLRREPHSELNILRRERHALTYSIRLANAKQRNTKFQDLVSSKPKIAHKLINDKLKDRFDPQVLRQQGSDTLLFKSEDVLQETQNYFEKLNSAPHSRTHTYQPNMSRNYPWQEQNALDHFDIKTHVGREGFGFRDLDDHIKNPVLFQWCLRNTKLGKTPGPDGVCNERYLPEAMQLPNDVLLPTRSQ